jgi:hypothetical protein
MPPTVPAPPASGQTTQKRPRASGTTTTQ